MNSDRRLNSETEKWQLEPEEEGSNEILNCIRTLSEERTVLLPLYIRACLREIVNVSINDESATARFDFYITYPYRLPSIVAQTLKLNKWGTKDFEKFLRNNITLELGGTFIDIAYDDGPTTRKYSPNVDRQVVASMVDLALGGHRLKEEEEAKEEGEREAQESTQSYFYRRVRMKNSNYVTYIVSGQFQCQGTLSSKFFPYHQLQLEVVIRANTLIHRGITIRYNIMRQGEEDWKQKQFALGPELPALGRFGIYELMMGLDFRSVEARKEESLTTWQEEDVRVAGLRAANGEERDKIWVTRAISFGFQLYCFNLPFIVRYQIPMWVLCLASFALNFARVDQIANVYGNIILISVAQISLLSSFRQSNFNTEFGSIYELTLGGFLAMSLHQIIIQTKHFYSTQDGEQELSKDQLFKFSTALGLFLFVLNVLCLTIIGFRRQRQRRRDNHPSKEWMGLQWSDDQLASCVRLKGPSSENTSKEDE